MFWQATFVVSALHQFSFSAERKWMGNAIWGSFNLSAILSYYGISLPLFLQLNYAMLARARRIGHRSTSRRSKICERSISNFNSFPRDLYFWSHVVSGDATRWWTGLYPLGYLWWMAAKKISLSRPLPRKKWTFTSLAVPFLWFLCQYFRSIV